MKKIIALLLPNMAFIGAMLISAGFIVAEKTPAPQSIGVVMIFLHPFLNGGLKTAFQNIYKNRYATAMAVYYLLIVLSIWHLGNLSVYKQWVVMQLPLVLVPFGLSDEKSISKPQRNIIFATLIGVVTLAGIISFINYIIHFQAIQESITHSKPIPIVTGINHIYFSVLLAFAAGILQWGLFIEKMQRPLYRRAAWITFIIIVILLHTIAARTGLFCFYAEAVTSILWLFFKSKKILTGIFIGLGLVSLAVITVKIIPSESNRFDNTRLDLHKYESGDNINHYSVSMRFEALKVGWTVFMKNMINGVGPANITEAMDQEYTLENSDLITINRIKPHNEFLYSLVSMGIIGFSALCFMIFFPVFNGAVFRNYLFFMFIIVCVIAFQAEYLLERQVGITFFCLFYILLSNEQKDIKSRGTSKYAEILQKPVNFNPTNLN